MCQRSSAIINDMTIAGQFYENAKQESFKTVALT
jgi:hypothetical protein